MAKQKRRRRRPAWRGKRRAGDSLRERRPYKTRAELSAGKDAGWFLRVDKVFFWSGEWREISLAGGAVLTVLLHLADGDDAYRWLYVSDPDLMYLTGRSRPTVYNGLCNLIEHGCIEGERGGSQPGRYRLTEKVLRYSHGRRKKTRPKKAKPKPPAEASTTPESPPDVGIEIPEELAAAISPAAWRKIRKAHDAQHIRNAVIVYRNKAKSEAIKKPLALFNHLMEQNWVAERAAEILDTEIAAASATLRRQAQQQKQREDRERADAEKARHARDFTQEELDAFSEVALANLRERAPRLTWKIGRRAWTAEMWRLIEQAAQAAPETTQPENEADGPDVAAVAAQTI